MILFIREVTLFYRVIAFAQNMPNKKGLRLPSTSGDGVPPGPVAPAPPPVVTSAVPDAEYVYLFS